MNVVMHSVSVKGEEMAFLKKINLSVWIIIGLVAGVIFGTIAPDWAKEMKPLGDVFIRMIKMIVVPLIFSSLVMGIAGTGDFKSLGRLGGKSILWFEFATTVALLVGLVVVNVVEPGVGVGLHPEVGAATDTVNKAASASHIDHVQMLVNIIPTNIVDAMSRGDMLQIIFFSCVFAIAAAGIGKEGRQIIELSKDLAHIMFKVTHYVMYVSPIGIFGAIAYTVGTFGLGMLLPLIKLVLTLYGGLIIFLILMLLIASAVTKTNLFKLIPVLKEPLVLAFSTAASEAALPIAMEKLKKVGIPNHIVSFVLPLGYTFNLDGSTLYSSLAVVFLAQVYGVPFPIEQQIIMVLTLMLSTKGIAAIPGASLIVIAGTAAAFGLPVEGLALILGIDRILDMARTVCNLTGNCIAAALVGRWENTISAERLTELMANPLSDEEVEAMEEERFEHTGENVEETKA